MALLAEPAVTRGTELMRLLGRPRTAHISSPDKGVHDVAGEGFELRRERVTSCASPMDDAPVLPFVAAFLRLAQRDLSPSKTGLRRRTTGQQPLLPTGWR